eukprot:179817_1
MALCARLCGASMKWYEAFQGLRDVKGRRGEYYQYHGPFTDDGCKLENLSKIVEITRGINPLNLAEKFTGIHTLLIRIPTPKPQCVYVIINLIYLYLIWDIEKKK